jgi:hypothetical protein
MSQHEVGHEIEDDGMVGRIQGPSPKDLLHTSVAHGMKHFNDTHFLAKCWLNLGLLINLWIFHHRLRTATSIEQTQCHGRCCCEQDIVETDDPSFKQCLTGETAVQSKPKLKRQSSRFFRAQITNFHHVETHVLVEGIEQHFGQTLITPHAMNE